MENKLHTILLVEDDLTVAISESLRLEKEGFSVIHVTDGVKAIEAVNESEKIDIILMDIDLGTDKDGIGFANEILESHNIPIIFLTGDNSKETLNKIEQITSYGYVVKSSGFWVLIASINMALKLHKAHRELKLKEGILLENKNRYRAIYNASTIGIAQSNFDGKFVDVNPAFQMITGYLFNELIKMSWSDITHPVDRMKSLYFYNELREGRLENYSMEKRYIHKEGHSIWANVSVVVVKNEEGVPAFELGIVENITKRKEAENALSENESRYRDLFDEAPIGYHEIDREGVITRVNNTELRMLGYISDSEMIGKQVSDFVIQTEQSKHELQKKLQGKLTVGKTYRRDFKRKDGSLIPVIVCDRLILSANGSLHGIRSTIQDITDIKKAQDALVLSETKYRNIFENVQDVFFRTDISGILTEISPSIKRYSGYSIDYLLGLSVEEIYENSDDRKAMLAILIEKGEINDYEINLKNIDEHIVIASINAHLLYDDFQKPIGIEGSLRDISYRKNAELQIQKYARELKNLNATKDKFFSIIAHDLRGPFSGILSLSEMLSKQADVFSKDELQELGLELFNSSTNVYKLLEDLLDWSKLESGRMPFKPESLQFRYEIDKVFNLLKRNAEGKRITFVNQAEAASLVFADLQMLQMVLRNLVSNAIKFSYENSIVTVATKTEPGEITFIVKDCGVGMSDETVAKLFKPEIHFSTEGTKNEKGTGLGLILCKDIIEKHGGKIWVESQPDVGSKFFFTLSKPAGEN